MGRFKIENILINRFVRMNVSVFQIIGNLCFVNFRFYKPDAKIALISEAKINSPFFPMV